MPTSYVVWFAAHLVLMVAAGFAGWRFNAARRRDGQAVMTVFDRAAAFDLGSGIDTILEDNYRAHQAMIHRSKNPKVERWRIAAWIVLGLLVVNLLFGVDIAKFVLGHS